MADSPWGSQRPDSTLPHDAEIQEGIILATQAMQAAANAMTAATESFRRQTLLHGLPSGRSSYSPYRPPGDDHEDPGAALPRTPSRAIFQSIHHQSASALSPKSLGNTRPQDDRKSGNSRPATSHTQRLDYLPTTSVFSTRRLSTHSDLVSSAHNRTNQQNSRQSSLGTTLTDGSVETNVNNDLGAGAENWYMIPEIRRKGNISWPIRPVSEDQDRPEYEGPQSRPNRPQQAEQTSQMSAFLRPLEQPPPGLLSRGSRNIDEHDGEYFSPSIRMGRYTYTRTDTGGSGATLRDQYWQDQQPSRESSGRKLRAPKPPAKPSPNRPYGFSAVREVFFVLDVILAQVLMLAGLAQALVPQYIIGNSFPDTNLGTLAWYSAAYGLTAGSFVLPAGRLGDIFGHKKVFIFGLIWFGLWELAGGFSEYVQRGEFHGGTVFFIVCRAMQGVGAALLVPNGQAMIGRGYAPGPRKNMIMSLYGAAAPLGFVLGGAIASAFAQLVSWPWAFWTMAVVCILLAGASLLILPSTEVKPKSSEASLWKRLDGLGILLGVSGMVLFNFAFNQAPIVGWTTPYTYFILVIGALLLASFVYVELHAAYPLLPIAAMTPTTNFVLGCTGAGWACFSIWVYYALSFMQNLRGYSPLLSSAALAPAPVSGLMASLLAGFLLGKKVKPYIVLLISMVAFFAGSLLWALAPVRQSYWINSFLGVLIIPFGMDMSNPAASILLSNCMGKEHQGTAASLVVTTVNYSISLALGIAGSVEVAAQGDRGDLLAGYRAAQYLSVGLGGLGLLLAAIFALRSRIKKPRATDPGPNPR